MRALGVPFLDAMLSWPAGRRDTDGVWAKYWYANVEEEYLVPAALPSNSDETFPAHLESLVQERPLLRSTLSTSIATRRARP